MSTNAHSINDFYVEKSGVAHQMGAVATVIGFEGSALMPKMMENVKNRYESCDVKAKLESKSLQNTLENLFGDIYNMWQTSNLTICYRT